MADWHTVDWDTLTLSLSAMVATFRFKVGMIPMLAANSLLGVAYYLITGTT